MHGFALNGEEYLPIGPWQVLNEAYSEDKELQWEPSAAKAAAMEAKQRLATIKRKSMAAYYQTKLLDHLEHIDMHNNDRKDWVNNYMRRQEVWQRCSSNVIYWEMWELCTDKGDKGIWPVRKPMENMSPMFIAWIPQELSWHCRATLNELLVHPRVSNDDRIKELLTEYCDRIYMFFFVCLSGMLCTSPC